MLGYVLPAVLYLSTYKEEVKQAWIDILFFCHWKSMDSQRDTDHDEIENENEYNRTDAKNILNSNVNNDYDDSNNNNTVNNDNNNHSNNDNSNNNNINTDNNDCVIIFNNNYSNHNNQNELNVKSSKTFFNKKNNVDRKTFSNLIKSISRFFLPIFMIIFGILSMVIGVSSIFLF